jgi:hypothetical protein
LAFLDTECCFSIYPEWPETAFSDLEQSIFWDSVVRVLDQVVRASMLALCSR